MSQQHQGRVVRGRIELEGDLSALEGKRVTITIEALEHEEDPAARAYREAPPDDRPYPPEERARVEAARERGEFVTTDELRARLADHHKRNG